jgi:branched-chain amino acid transport system substrate-binding protein
MKGSRNVIGIKLALIVTVVCLAGVLFSSPAFAKGDEILIGAAVSMTGPLAPDGLEQKWAYEQAVDDWNKKGGIYIKEAGKKLPIRIVFADDESDTARVAAAMEKLIKIDKVDLMLSTHSASLLVAAVNAAEKYKMYYHVTTHWPEMWSPQKYQWSSLMFFSAGGASDVPFVIWESMLREEDRPKSVALLMEDSPDGAAFGQGFRAHATDHGYTFAVDEPWAIGSKDYSSQILKMKAKKVDAILLYGAPTDAITLVRQMKEMKLNVKYLHGWKGTWASEFYSALGKDANYVICDGFWSEDFPYPLCKELGQRYTEKFKKYTVSIGAFYGCAQTLFMAIERTQSYDKTVIRDAFRNAEYKQTVLGDLKFDENGLALFSSTANQWWDGKQMLFYPAVPGGYKLKLAPDWGKR